MKNSILLCGLLVALALPPAVCAAESHFKQKINFDDGWKFHLGHAADAAKDFNYTIANIFSKTGKSEGTAIHPGFNDSCWQSVHLPHGAVVHWTFELWSIR